MLDIKVVSIDGLKNSIAHHRPDHIISAVPDGEWNLDGHEIAKPDAIIPRTVIDIECAPFSPDQAGNYQELPWKQPEFLQGNARRVSELIALGQKLLSEKKNLHVLVHCQQGICRSPALALILMALDQGPGQETQTAIATHRICPHSRPSGELVAMADAALSRGGKLLSAWQEEFSHALVKPSLKERAQGVVGNLKTMMHVKVF